MADDIAQVPDPIDQPQASIDDNTPDFVKQFLAPELKEEKYGTPLEMGKTFAEGLSRGALGPIAPAVEKSIFHNEEEQKAREETNPGTLTAGELTSLVGGHALGAGVAGDVGKAVAKYSLPGVLNKVGGLAEGAAQTAGIGKIGSAAVKGAIENLAFQAQDEGTKLVLNEPNSVGTAVTDMGLATLLGGAVGGGFAGIPALWKEVGGRKLGGLLYSFARKAGGIEGIETSPVQTAARKAGVVIPAESLALVSGDTAIENDGWKMLQSDATKSSRGFQKTHETFMNTLGGKVGELLGKTPEEIASTPMLDRYETGNRYLNTLADEYDKQIEPFKKGYEELTEKFKPVSTEDTLKSTGDSIMQHAIQDGWTSSPSSDKMKLVNQVLKELPLQKNLRDLHNFTKEIGEQVFKRDADPQFMREAGKVVDILRNSGDDLIEKQLGPQEVEHFRALREGYRVQAALRDELQSSLRIKGGGSIGGYGNAIREAARTDAETLLGRLSARGDASLLSTLRNSYPETAKLVRDYHVDRLLDHASDGKGNISVNKFTSAFNNPNSFSPQLQALVANPETIEKLHALSDVQKAFETSKWNWSNTARVNENHMDKLAGGAVAVLGMLSGHGFITSALMGQAVKAIGKDVPDAIKLAMFKYLGTPKEVNPTAFKHAVEYINSTLKGENAASKAVENLFKSGAKVLPDHMIPSDRDRNKLKNTLDALNEDQRGIMDVTGGLDHYMPDHAAAVGRSVANTYQFLKAQKPNSQPTSMFDTKRELTPLEKYQYNRTLDIAQQPLIVMDHIAKGTLTPKDVMVQKALYPDLYARLSQKLLHQAIETQSKGLQIPYRTKMSLSLYLGHPLDSTLTPQGIIAAQLMAPTVPPQAGGAGMPRKAPTASAGSAFKKLPKLYGTPSQDAEADRSNRE